MREIGSVSILLARLLWHRLSRHREVLKPSLGYGTCLLRSWTFSSGFGFLRDMHCLSMLGVPTIGASLVTYKSCSRWKALVATSAAVYSSRSHVLIQFKPPHLILPPSQNKCPWVSLKSKWSIDSGLYRGHLFWDGGNNRFCKYVII
jgi:hypothetical protein